MTTFFELEVRDKSPRRTL